MSNEVSRILLARRPSDVRDDLLSRSFDDRVCCLIFAPVNVTMSQKLSLLQSANSVPRALTADIVAMYELARHF
jgi:hypothetical protein